MQQLLEDLLTQEQQQREAAARGLHSLTDGNPGSLFACMELHKAGHMSLQELVPLLQSLGLVGSAFYLLHKEFGGKDPARTVQILRALQADPTAESPLVRSGERHPVVNHCLAEMRCYL